MMEVKDLTARTRKGKLLLDHVSFTLEPGGCTGLTGASGSGKTNPSESLAGGLGLRCCDLRRAVSSGREGPASTDGESAAGALRHNIRVYPAKSHDSVQLHVSVGAQMAETFRKRLHIEKRAAQKLSMRR